MDKIEERGSGPPRRVLARLLALATALGAVSGRDAPALPSDLSESAAMATAEQILSNWVKGRPSELWVDGRMSEEAARGAIFCSATAVRVEPWERLRRGPEGRHYWYEPAALAAIVAVDGREMGALVLEVIVFDGVSLGKGPSRGLCHWRWRGAAWHALDAAEGVGRRPDWEELEELRCRLRAAPANEALALAETLASRGVWDGEIHAAFDRPMNAEAETTRREAILALVRSAPSVPDARAVALRGLRDTSPEVRKLALIALGRLWATDLCGWVATLATVDSDPGTRELARDTEESLCHASGS